MFVSYNDALMS